jgi:hypothetical protein
MTEALASKTCTPCRGGIPPLTREQAELFMRGLRIGSYWRKLTASSGASGFAISGRRLPLFKRLVNSRKLKAIIRISASVAVTRRSLCRPRRLRDCTRTTSSWPPRLTAYWLARPRRNVGSCEGFRTPAITNVSPRMAAGVRKPRRDETTGRGTYWSEPRAQLWGFGSGRATAEVGEAITARRRRSTGPLRLPCCHPCTRWSAVSSAAAPAPSGQATAPPSTAMNSRRFICNPQGSKLARRQSNFQRAPSCSQMSL